MNTWIKRIVIGIVLLALVGGGAAWYVGSKSAGATTFRTAPIKRGDITSTISATGTIEPEEVIDVGAQVAGQILSFGTDKNGKTVDYDSQVEAGTILARIDDSVYQSDVASAKAQLAQSQAGVAGAKADLEQLNAKRYQAQRDWERAQTLDPKSNALAATQYDAYKSAYEAANAAVSVGRAAIAQAQAAVTAAQANLDRAEQNLGYCTIKSPVNGTIIDRRVNIGQTVVASLNAPSLFLLAKDLRRMQVWASVNEADIGKIHAGQHVTFTVDAFPARVFDGTVNQVRLNATMTQNVVTYTVEINTDNSDGTLLPYLTANVSFHVDQHDNTLLVPNAALRWEPTDVRMIAPDIRNEFTSTQVENGNADAGSTSESETGNVSHRATTAPAGAHATNRAGSKTSSQPYRHGTLWLVDGTFVRPVRVRTGLTDGTNTEVIAQNLKAGDQVVTGDQSAAAAGADDARNPFTPQFHRRH